MATMARHSAPIALRCFTSKPDFSVRPAMRLVKTRVMHQHTDIQLPATIHSKVGVKFEPVNFFDPTCHVHNEDWCTSLAQQI